MTAHPRVHSTGASFSSHICKAVRLPRADATEPRGSGSCLPTSLLSPEKLSVPLLLWLLIIIGNNAINSSAVSMGKATPGT